MNEKIEIKESVMIKVEDNNNENGESIILEPGDVIELLPPDDLELDEFPYSDSERTIRERSKRNMELRAKIESKKEQEEKKENDKIKTQEEKPYELKRKVDPNSFIETREKKYENFHSGKSDLLKTK